MRGHILVIDDERYVYEDLEFGLGKAHEIHYASTLTRIRSILEKYAIDLAMVDLNIKVGDQDRFSGLEYIKTLRSKNPTMTIAVLSGYSDENRIVQATKNGADHYLIKSNLDTDSNEFRAKIGRWINAKKKLDQERDLEQEEAWGGTEFAKEIVEDCLKFQDEKQSYFLLAEKGLGAKQLLSQVYHRSRYFSRTKLPVEQDLSFYLPISIAQFLELKRGTAQDNFFKHIPSKILHLKNLHQQPLSIQEMFLKAILSGRFVGQNELHQLQFIFVLDQDPESLIKEGKLSTELYHAIPSLRIPPLRERRAEYTSLIAKWQKKHKIPSISFEPTAFALLRRYPFPSNLPEFYTVLKHSINKHQKQFPLDWEQKSIQAESLPYSLHQTPSDLHEEMQFEVARIHLRFIEEALLRWDGERRQKDLAAQDLNAHSADNLKKTYINKYWDLYPELVKGFSTIMKKYKLKNK